MLECAEMTLSRCAIARGCGTLRFRGGAVQKLFLILLLLAATFGTHEAVPQDDARKALANTWSATSTKNCAWRGV